MILLSIYFSREETENTDDTDDISYTYDTDDKNDTDLRILLG